MGGGRRRRWTDDQLLLAVREARSMADACRRLGLSPKGGNRFTVAARVQALGLPTDHWTGQGWRRGLRQAVPVAGGRSPSCSSCIRWASEGRIRMT